MRTSTEQAAASLLRVEATLDARRRRSPSLAANAARNARAEIDRASRWRPARDAFWRFLDPYLLDGARVAIVGAGNGDDLPIGRIAERVGSLSLLDLDARAARGARRRRSWKLRRQIDVVEHDVTGGVADAIALAAARGEVVERVTVPEGPLPGGPYDLVVGDLFYSQLLYPALLDLGVKGTRREAFLSRYAPLLTRSVVARLHASGPVVVHVHDPLAWWPGHEQPVALEQILRLAEGEDLSAALSVVARGFGPVESDPRPALRSFGIGALETALWRWPFAPDVEYLVCATLAGTRP